MRSATRYQPSLSHYLHRGPPRLCGQPWTGNRLCFTGKLSGRSEGLRHMHAAYFDGRRFVFIRGAGPLDPTSLGLELILRSLIAFRVYAEGGLEVEHNYVRDTTSSLVNG